MVFVVIFIFFVIKSLTRSFGQEIWMFGARQDIEFLYDLGQYMCMQGNWITYILTAPFALLCCYISARSQMYDER